MGEKALILKYKPFLLDHKKQKKKPFSGFTSHSLSPAWLLVPTNVQPGTVKMNCGSMKVKKWKKQANKMFLLSRKLQNTVSLLLLNSRWLDNHYQIKKASSNGNFASARILNSMKNEWKTKRTLKSILCNCLQTEHISYPLTGTLLSRGATVPQDPEIRIWTAKKWAQTF